MKPAVTWLLLCISCAVALAQRPTVPVTLTLSDGRVLEEAVPVAVRIDGQVRVHYKGMPENGTLIPAREAPFEWQQYIVNEMARTAEIQRKIRGEIEANRRRHLVDIAKQEAARAAKREAERVADGSAPTKPLTEEQLAALREEARRKILVQTRDGILPMRFYVDAMTRALPELQITVKNFGPQSTELPWRSIRALAVDGSIVEPIDFRFEIRERASFDLAADEERVFNLALPAGRNYVAISWADRPELGWRNELGMVVDPDAARAEALEQIKARHAADRSGKLRPVAETPVTPR
jgi:hypothetical protein